MKFKIETTFVGTIYICFGFYNTLQFECKGIANLIEIMSFVLRGI